MQSFLRRLKYYGIGFGFGLLFVIFFFKNRGCTWLPSNRVRNSIRERVLVLPENQQTTLAQKGITLSDIFHIIDKGDVDFSESLKQAEPKVYLFEGSTIKGEKAKLYVTLPSESFVSEIHFKEASIKQVRNTVRGKGRMISFPNDKQLIYLDSTSVFDHQRGELGIRNGTQLLKWMKSSGKIDFAKTNFRLRPKVEHVISCRDDRGNEIEFRAVWYKEKINIVSFDTPYSNVKD